MSEYGDDASVARSAATAPAPPPAMPTGTGKRPKPPQETINEFWAKFTSKSPSKATTVIPQNNYADIVAKKNTKASATTTQASYEEAAAMCRAKVEKIVKECRRINKKYRDPHFDIEMDLKLGVRDCLQSLSNWKDTESRPGEDLQPQSVKRVGDIFDDPKFYIDGPTTNDVRQGRTGDCWLMAALCTLSNKKGLIEKLCVAYDQAVGVYGFVFHRDGEWISEIVDDFLYLIKPDYDESYFDRILFEDVEHVNAEEAYRKIYQSNSSSLYFAQCQHPQETWLPLLEKCYAKAHGDYAAIEGGYGGEGIEDLTGGVTSEVWTSDILDKERFWTDELLKVNDEFLFGCSTGVWGAGWGERKGIIESHAYSIQKAVEVKGKRLLKLKNPWGKGEWNGPWSDGSKEWDAEWLTLLDHRFGDDGDFWIEYSDLLRKYQAFDRTRLFGPEWRVTQTWTTLAVPWTLDYHDTHFSFTIAKDGPVVIVLAQLDDRYFRGLEGQYRFEFSFRLHKAGQKDYIVRSQTPYRMTRSCNIELELEAGEYEVRVKVNAVRIESLLPIEEVVRNYAKDRRDKLVRMGLAYDLAHSKGKVVETAAEKAAREAHEKKEKVKKRAEIKKKLLSTREQGHYLKIKQWHREQRAHERAKTKKKAKAEAKKAKKEAKKAAKAAEKAAKEAEVKVEIEIKVEPETEKEPEVKDETEVKTEPEIKKESDDEEVAVKTETEPETKPVEGEKAETKTEDKPAAETVAEKAEVAEPAKEEKKEDSTTPEDTPTTGSDKTTSAVETTEEKPTESAPEAEVKTEKEESAPVTETDEKPAEETAEVTEEKSEETQDAPEETQEHQEGEAEEESEEEEESEDDLDSIAALSDLSEREIEIQIDELIPPEAEEAAPAEEDPDEFEQDPWNAVVVVGLRVYYKPGTEDKPDEVLKLKVIRPIRYEDDKKDGKEKGEGKECETTGLDVDDSAKDATLEGEVTDRKKSIMGDGRKADA